MAKLSAFTLNAAAINAGRWIEVGPPDETFRLKTRGYTGKYRDAVARMTGEYVRRMNRGKKPGDRFFTEADVPTTDQDLILAEALAEHCILDVEELYREDGSKVTIDEFKALIMTEEGKGLALLSIEAAGRVASNTEDTVKDAVGNSPTGSVGS